MFTNRTGAGLANALGGPNPLGPLAISPIGQTVGVGQLAQQTPTPPELVGTPSNINRTFGPGRYANWCWSGCAWPDEFSKPALPAGTAYYFGIRTITPADAGEFALLGFSAELRSADADPNLANRIGDRWGSVMGEDAAIVIGTSRALDWIVPGAWTFGPLRWPNLLASASRIGTTGPTGGEETVLARAFPAGTFAVESRQRTSVWSSRDTPLAIRVPAGDAIHVALMVGPDTYNYPRVSDRIRGYAAGELLIATRADDRTFAP